MRNSWKVAKWEVKRNMKSKSFLISLVTTPIIFLLFAFIPTLFDSEEEAIHVLIRDELNVYAQVEQMVTSAELNWELEKTDLSEEEIQQELTDRENTAFIVLNEAGLEQGEIPVYMTDDVGNDFLFQAAILEAPLRQLQLQRLDLTEEQLTVIGKGVKLTPQEVAEETDPTTDTEKEEGGDRLKHLIPGIAAGVVLFSIVITGMMTFTSASQEKKDKVAEIILSSITTNDLMQGKIIGYFILGITQVTVWLAFLIPVLMWRIDFPILEYLLVPELLLFLFIALAGYLLYSAIFVGMGATVEDVSSAGNFQGIVMMIPFIPAMFMAPIIMDANGIVAKVLTFIPLTTPTVLIIRLATLEEWPWLEIIISLVILLVFIWLVMKAAGKIFKVGILLYGKNATPKEIWRWLRA